MTVIVCVEDKGGMMFNHRRVSRDREVLADVERELCGGTLYLSEYSRSLFAKCPVSVVTSDEFLDIASEGDVCFVEDRPLLPHIERISRMVVYRWNKRYPYDVSLDVDPEREGFTLLSVTEFAGYSHEKITKEIYERR